MRILVDILHPAHVHKFRNIIKELEKRGHTVFVTARDKDVTLEILKAYNTPFVCWKKGKETRFGKISETLTRFVRMYLYCRKLKPDVMLGFGGLFIAPVGKLLRIPSIISCEEAEYRSLSNFIYSLGSIICTPKTFKKDFGKKHIRFDGFAELSYLQRFKSSNLDFQGTGIKPEDKYFFLRLVSWKAIHDYGHQGLSQEIVVKLVVLLKEKGKVVISAEGNMPEKLQKYLLAIEPSKIHSILHNASLFIGDGQIMAVEAGLLGTPSIRFNTMVGGKQDKGKFDELDKREIVYSISDRDMLFKKVYTLLKDKNSKSKAQKKAKDYLKNKADVTIFFVDLIENKAWER